MNDFEPGILVVIKHPSNIDPWGTLPIPYETDASFEWKKSDDPTPFIHPMGFPGGIKAVYIDTVTIDNKIYRKLIVGKEIVYVSGNCIQELV